MEEKRLIDAIQYRKEFMDSRDFEPMKILDLQTTVNAIIIPENATNGQMVMATFPNCEPEFRDDVVDVYGLSSFSVTFKRDWWDAKYELEEKP